MITKRDLQEAIAKCNGKVDPCPDDAILMAACLVIKDHFFGSEHVSVPSDGYSAFAQPLEPAETSVHINSGSEFSSVIDGKPQSDGWAVMDELMETLRIINPRLYDGVIRKIRG